MGSYLFKSVNAPWRGRRERIRRGGLRMRKGGKLSSKLNFELLTRITELIKEMDVYVEAVIVEGAHDEITLRTLGFKRPIIKYAALKVNEAVLVTNIADKYADRVIAVLTDFDSNGEATCKRLTAKLQSLGVKVDSFYRRRLKDLLRPIGINAIESIYSLKRRCYKQL